MAALSACTASSHWPRSLVLWAELQDEGRPFRVFDSGRRVLEGF